jgi:hypothetical protein
MAVENKSYSKNDLEHVKFTPESNPDNSIVQFKQYEYPVVPDRSVGVFTEFLESTADQSTNMNINGSVTPVTFSWEPNPAYGLIQIQKIKMVIVADNITNFFDFANRTALANGVDIIGETIEGQFPYATLKQNIDFVQYTTKGGSSSFNLNGNNTQDIQVLELFASLPILKTDGLKYNVVINDDLTSLSYMKVSVIFETLE